jgi:hypothetical protein
MVEKVPESVRRGKIGCSNSLLNRTFTAEPDDETPWAAERVRV